MKSLRQSIFYSLLIATLIFTACKKDDDGGGGGDAPSGILKAKVSGTAYTSESSLTSATVVNSNGASTLSITANTMNGKNITLGIGGGFEGVGSYDIGGGANVFVTASYTEVDVANPMDAQMWVAPYDTSVAGKINISEVTDTSIKGTFNFKGKNADGTFKDVTEGSFNVNIR